MQRFWNKVNKNSGVFGVDGKYPTECWEWQGGSRGNGYGAIKINKKVIDVHRVSWTLHFGLILHGLCVCHKCDNRKCVRSDHLFLGTRDDNNKDMVTKGRNRRGKTKLSPEDVENIRQEYRPGVKGYGFKALAKKYQVSHNAIKGIVRYKYWK
jgi:hypothetical protein